MVTKSNFQQRLLFLITLTLRRNNLWFTALKALEASIERTASESSLLKFDSLHGWQPHRLTHYRHTPIDFQQI